MKLLCKAMSIQRSSFYAWKKHLSHPSEREKNLASNVRLFQEYHSKYPSHGYRWLNAKIRLDKNIVLSVSEGCCLVYGLVVRRARYSKGQSKICCLAWFSVFGRNMSRKQTNCRQEKAPAREDFSSCTGAFQPSRNAYPSMVSMPYFSAARRSMMQPRKPCHPSAK